MGGINLKIISAKFKRIQTILTGVGVFFFYLSLSAPHYSHNYDFTSAGEGPDTHQKWNVYLRDNHSSLANIIEIYTVMIIMLCFVSLALVLIAKSYDNMMMYNLVNSAILAFGSTIVVLLLLNFNNVKEEYRVGIVPLVVGGQARYSFFFGTAFLFVIFGLMATGIGRVYLRSTRKMVGSTDVNEFTLKNGEVLEDVHEEIQGKTPAYRKIAKYFEIILVGVIIIITLLLVPKQYII